MTILGEGAASVSKLQEEEVDDEEAVFPPRVKIWMKQNDLSMEQLRQIFHFHGGAIEIIQLPGDNKKDKVIAAYILTGISNYLLSGEQRFDDAPARVLSERFAVYDSTNHAKYAKAGKEFVGSKEAGWTLTHQGLKHAATLIKGLS